MANSITPGQCCGVTICSPCICAVACSAILAIPLIILGPLGVHNIIPMGTGAGWALTSFGIMGLATYCCGSVASCLGLLKNGSSALDL